MEDISVILHNIRSIHNIASIFRSADGAGVKQIFLTGYSPSPIDRFGRKVSAFSKVSLGAEDTISWRQVDIQEIIHECKKEGVQVVAVEQAPQAITYKNLNPTSPVVFIFGNEVDGVPQSVLELCDAVVDIPMKGKKESLNVSVSAGIILYHFTKE